jgi:prolipoprotein diacylglyceryltransferase
VHFPPDSFVTRLFGAAAVHPTQLYSSFTGLAVFAILMLYDRRRVLPVGRLFALYLMLDAVGRFGLDFSRYYEANVYILGLTVNQVICIGLFLLGLAVWFRRAAPVTPAAEVLLPAEEMPVAPGPEAR